MSIQAVHIPKSSTRVNHNQFDPVPCGSSLVRGLFSGKSTLSFRMFLHFSNALRRGPLVYSSCDKHCRFLNKWLYFRCRYTKNVRIIAEHPRASFFGFGTGAESPKKMIKKISYITVTWCIKSLPTWLFVQQLFWLPTNKTSKLCINCSESLSVS